MPTYSTPARAIYARLATSPSLLAVLSGGVWDRPLARTGPKATPTAFDPTQAGRQLPAAVVPDAGEDRDGLGPAAAFLSFPRVWFYADDDPSGAGRTVIEAAIAQATSDLDGWGYTTTNGTGIVLGIAGRFGIREDPGDTTRLVAYLRVQADGLWRTEA